MQHTFCDACGQFDLLCRCDPLMDLPFVFDHLVDAVMIGRRPRHWLWREHGRNPLHDSMIKWFDAIMTTDDLNAWREICHWALNGSPVCQEFLLGHTDLHKVLEELNRSMDEMDDQPICTTCNSTDKCGCNGRCPLCQDYQCDSYECCVNMLGAFKDAYLKTIRPVVPVRMRPTTNMQPSNNSMRNAAAALFDSCALSFTDTERCGLEYCTTCHSDECEHCICVTCGQDACTHFFVPPPMNPALALAWHNAVFDGQEDDGAPNGYCLCTTCDRTFQCPDWDPSPMRSVCNGDCDTCPECIAHQISNP